MTTHDEDNYPNDSTPSPQEGDAPPPRRRREEGNTSAAHPDAAQPQSGPPADKYPSRPPHPQATGSGGGGFEPQHNAAPPDAHDIEINQQQTNTYNDGYGGGTGGYGGGSGGYGHDPEPLDPDRARRAIMPVVICSLVVASLSILFQLFSIVTTLTLSTEEHRQQTIERTEQMLDIIESLAPGSLPPESRDLMRESAEMAGNPRSLFNLAQVFIVFFATLFITFGLWRMRQLRSWELGIAASIMMMLPCTFHYCCIVGLPLGIWSLVLLNKDYIKDAFQ